MTQVVEQELCLGRGGGAHIDDATVGGQSSVTPRSRERVTWMRRRRTTSIAKHNQMKEPKQHIWIRRRGWMESSPDEGAENTSVGPISPCLSPIPLRAHRTTRREAIAEPCARLPSGRAMPRKAARLDPHQCVVPLLRLP
jgi:hypothetical protein